MEQEVYVKVDILENEISYYDTAFDGLFQTQKGWGYVSCPRLWSEEIEIILSEIRKT
jgi:hypothetical protein